MLDLDAVAARLDRAHREIGEIAAQTPAKRWRMSIPAQPDRDSDLLISQALNDGEDLLAEVRVARKCIEQSLTSEQLRMLADWLDLHDNNRQYRGPREVQNDLRWFADAIDTYGESQ